MANFVVNSTGTTAIKMSEITALVINERLEGFGLEVRLSSSEIERIVFETDATLEGIQAKATTLLTALES